uniref:NADH-ubiquinone oxidoreductase chain 4 n=1 Tax=Pediculus humanus subsp. corporis TaxID=121224 RepID=X2D1N9_PEDHC|nr:NADH dehydrogenase subunit 4 [Pediculus humanus corporis]
MVVLLTSCFMSLVMSFLFKNFLICLAFSPSIFLLALHSSPFGGWPGCTGSYFGLIQSFSSWNMSVSLMLQISVLLMEVLLMKLNLSIKSCILILAGSSIFYLTDSWLMFFISFEFTLLPIFYMVYAYSTTPERLRASWFLFIYTLIGSLPLFVVIFCVGKLSFWMFPSCVGLEMFNPVFISMAFLIKLPLYFMHSWLPKAHVEASVEGSVLLAGILLKFGSFGLMRSSIITSWNSQGLVESLFYSLSFMGSLIGAVKALLKSDLKKVVAYSSVSHMNMSMLAFLTLKPFPIYGFCVGGLAHSFSASVMFIMVTLLYSSVGSRNILVMKNNMKMSSGVGLFVFLSWAANMALPPFLGFASEFIYVSSVLMFMPKLIVILLASMFLTSIYSSINMTITALSWLSQSKASTSSNVEWMMSVFTLTMPAIVFIISLNWLFLFY